MKCPRLPKAPVRLRRPAQTARARPSSAAAAEAQLRYMVGWWGRAAGQALALNAALMKAQAEAVAPIHKTATANARRLRKGP